MTIRNVESIKHIYYEMDWSHSKGCLLSVIFDPSVQICRHLPDPPPPVRVDTNFDYDTEFFSKNSTPDIHVHHSSPYKNTKKVSHKVKYL